MKLVRVGISRKFLTRIKIKVSDIGDMLHRVDFIIDKEEGESRKGANEEKSMRSYASPPWSFANEESLNSLSCDRKRARYIIETTQNPRRSNLKVQSNTIDKPSGFTDRKKTHIDLNAIPECDPVDLLASESSSSVQAFPGKPKIIYSVQNGLLNNVYRHIGTSERQLKEDLMKRNDFVGVESRVETHFNNVPFCIGWILRKEPYQPLIDDKKLLEARNRLE